MGREESGGGRSVHGKTDEESWGYIGEGWEGRGGVTRVEVQ